MSQFDRLLKLVKKTGDKVVMYDSYTDESLVLMGLDEYEYLLESRPKVHTMSSDQLLNQINREISIWRSTKDQDEEMEEYWMEEDEEEIEDDSSWEQVSNILNKQYGVGGIFEDEEDIHFNNTPIEELYEQDDAIFSPEPQVTPEPQVFVEPIGETEQTDDIPEIVSPLPHHPQPGVESDIEEESLPGEGPVFYEEQI